MTTRRHMDELEIGAPVDEAEQRAFRAIADYAFDPSPPLVPDIKNIGRQGPENFRLARVGGHVAGGLGMLVMGQWFGGRSVPMVGVNAVAVAPEHRSRGIGSRLLRAMFEELHARDIPLSTLYPATQVVYRRAGYEHAGVAMGYALPAHALDPRGRSLEMRRANDSDGDEGTIRALYAERARRTAGNLDRNDYMWQRKISARDTVLNMYIVERDGAPEGYIVYEQRQSPDERDRNLAVRDLVALTPEAARTVLAFLADHRSTVDNIQWMGAPADPLLFHLPNQGYKITWYEQWMLRVVDVRGALTARGYPPALQAELHVDVRDDILGWNAGRWTLTVDRGRGEVRPGGTGGVTLDIRGLAPLYSGYLSAEELRSTGLVEGTADNLALATLVFGGPSPWMADGF